MWRFHFRPGLDAEYHADGEPEKILIRLGQNTAAGEGKGRVADKADGDAGKKSAHQGGKVRIPAHSLPVQVNLSEEDKQHDSADQAKLQKHPEIGVMRMVHETQLPGLDGFYVAVSHSGVTLGPLWGKITASEVLDGQPDPRVATFRAARFLG